MKKILQKYILAFVSFVMLISVIHVNPIQAEEKDMKSKTDAKMIIENYDLTSKEQSILSHDSIKSKTYSYIEPTDLDADSLIEVDADKFVIYAKPYVDGQGNTWIPEKAIVNENDKSIEYVLDDGETSFEAIGDNYSIEVKYSLYISIDKETQLRLLNTPYWLTYGIEALDVLYGVSIDLESVADYYMPQLIKLRDGKDTPYGISISDSNYIQAVNDLEKQLKKNKNSSKYFDINEEILIYEPYCGISDQEYYFSEHAANLRDVAIKMKTNLEYIAYSQGFETIIKFASSIDQYKDLVAALETMINYMETIIDDLDYALEEENWIGMDYDLLSVVEGETGIVDLLTKRGTVDEHSNDYILDRLFVASKTLKCAINRDRVNVVVVANVIDGLDSNDLTRLESKPIEVALRHEMSAEDVSKVIKDKGIEAELLKDWEEKYQVCEEYYDRSVSDFGDKLTEDITYIITYTPKSYNVVYSDNGDDPLNVYYGYQLSLPRASSGFGYEYTINDVKYRENDVIRIVNDTTIDRIIGKKKVTDRLLDVLANDSRYNFSDLAKAILMNEALLSDMVEYRIVEEMDVNSVIDYDNDTKMYSLSVNSYPSGIEGMVWEPIAFTVMQGGIETETKYKINDGKATFEIDYLDGVNVYYELAITKTENIKPVDVTDDYLLTRINLPYTLLEESKVQIESLDYLASLAKPNGYLTMGSTIYSALGMIKSNYEDKYGKDTSLYPSHILAEYNALIELRNECFNHSKGSQLYVYEYVLKYMDLGLIAYYSDEYGYEKYQYQLDLLIKHLNTVKNSEEFNLLLTGQLAPYKEKVEKLIDVLDDLVLVEPNKNIDSTHPSAGKLFDLLDDNESCDQYDSSLGLIHRTNVQKPLEGKVSIIMSATVNGERYKTTSVVYDVNKVLTQKDVNNIRKAYEELYKDFNSKHYTKLSYNEMPVVGQRITEDIYITDIWKSKVYDVYVQDTLTGNQTLLQEVTYEDTTIVLEKPEVGYRYDYQILDEIKYAETSDLVYTITVENFDQLFKDGSLVIKRTLVDLTKEKLTNMFENINKTFEKYNSGFVLTKDDDGYHAILRVDPSESEIVQKQVLNIIVGMKDSDYGYVAIGDRNQALWNAQTAQISVQPYLDAMLQSGFNTNQLVSIIDDEGHIKETVSDSLKQQDVIVGVKNDLELLGGLLYDSTLYLGTTQDDEEYVEVDFIVSVEDFDKDSDLLKQLKIDLLNAKEYHSFDTDKGQLNLSYSFSDDIYSLIVSGMVLSGVIDLDDINHVTMEQLDNYLCQFKDMLNDDRFSSQTLLNTYRELGIDIDLSDREELIDTLIDMFRSYSFEHKDVKEDGVSGQLKYDLTDIIKDLDILEEVQALIEDHEISIPVCVTYTNLNEDYEAVVFNPYQNNPIRLIKKLDNVQLLDNENSVIVLKDIKGNITLSKIISLDLNGYKINGNISSNDNCVILDSKNTGSVTGSLSKNIEVAGGSYISNIQSSIKDGYMIEDNRVISKYYTIEEIDGKIIVEINPKLFYDHKDYYHVITTIIAKVNDYTKAKVMIGDYELYLSSYNTLEDFYKKDSSSNLIDSALNELDVQGLLNDLLESIYDYENIVNSGNIAVYTMNTNSYSFDFHLNPFKNTIEGNIKQNEDVNSKDIIFKMKEDKSYENVLTVFKDIVEMEYDELEIKDIQYDHSLKVTVDYVKTNIKVKNDVKYTIMLGAILAYGTKDEMLHQAMSNYVLYDTERENLKMDLLEAIHDLTTEEFVNAIKLVSDSDVSFTDICKELGYSDFSQSVGQENNLSDFLDEVMQDYVDYLSKKFELYEISGDSSLLLTEYNFVNYESFDELNVSLSLIADLPCKHRTTYEFTAIEPTCTKEGTIEIRCEECNEVLGTKSIDPKGHGETYKIGLHSPTCEDEGYTGDIVCMDCFETVEVGTVIPALGHKTSIINAIEATCSKEGYSGDAVCDICHKIVEKGKVLEKVPHIYVDGICEICNEEDPDYSAYPLGDVSGDGKVNALDYIKIKNHIMGTKFMSEDELKRADVSGDHKISALDYIKIKNHIMGMKKLF